MAFSSPGVDGIPWSKDKWLCPSIEGHLLKPMKRMRRQASGGSAPLPSGFHLACPLLTLVFILSYILLHSIFFSSLYLSLPMALANTSQGLQTTLGDNHSDGLWNCTHGAHTSRRHRNRHHPRLQFLPGCRRCRVREPQGQHAGSPPRATLIPLWWRAAQPSVAPWGPEAE